MQKAYARARSKSSQHTVIPPVIYSKIYSDAIDIIKAWDADKFNSDAEKLIDAYSDLSVTGSNSNKKAGITRSSYQNRLDAFLTHEEKTYARPGNKLFFDSKVKNVGQIEESSLFYGCKNITGITFIVRRIQAYLARLILQETAMREEELLFLLNEPLKIVNTQKGTVFTIQGKETKISGGDRSSWVVSKNGKIAHDILRKLSDFSYQLHVKATDKPKWLFPKMSCALADKSDKNVTGKWIAPDGRTTFCKVVDDKPTSLTSLFQYKPLCENAQWVDRTGEYTLSSADVNFLHIYGSSENRLNNNVQPDQVFSITEHQFRRSLAFYASASDLLAIADLKFQLKHIAIVTTYYYSDGGKALKESGLLLDEETYVELNQNMIKDRAHTDIILRQELISTLEDSRKALFGPGCNAVKRFSESITKSADPEKEWLDLAKEGAIATKELPHGWCITTKPCNDFANQNFDQCFNCANGVLDRDKTVALIKEIKAQAKSAKNDFNKKSYQLLSNRIEEAATSMYQNLFEDLL